jgi:hypothetical protein
MELMNSGKESETPRTDAVFWKFHTHDDIVNLARDLERENANLRVLVKQAADWLDYMGRSQSSAILREALNP